MWRNWQTRRPQKPVVATPWWFKSTHPHQIINSKGESANGSPFEFIKLWPVFPITPSIFLNSLDFFSNTKESFIVYINNIQALLALANNSCHKIDGCVVST